MSWPTVPEDLLAGPRGRHVCFEVVSPYAGDRLDRCPGWRGLRFGSGEADLSKLAAELAAVVAATDLDAVAATRGETGLLGYLAEAVTWATYWQPSHDWERPLMTDAVRVALEPVARAVTAAPAAAWWPSELEPDRQQYVQFLSSDGDFDLEPPALTGAAGRVTQWRSQAAERERDAASLPSDPAANYSGWWWSTPALAGLVSTTRSVPGLGAVRLSLVEDSLGWTEAVCWRLVPRPDARVYEIRGPEDWTSLVGRYPFEVTKSRWHDWFKVTGRAGTWLIPDYSAVAADYDGIHLTVGGYLTTAGRALAVDSDAATLLAGWDPDQAYWLADVLSMAGGPVRWEDREGDTLSWTPAPAGEPR
jgi:hypothetical protein